MRVISVRALAALILTFSWSLTSCGGGNSSGTVTPPPPPPPTEFLFGAGDNTVLAFTIDTQTGLPTQTASVSGNQGGFGIVANPSVTFLYADDEIADGIDAFSVSSSGALSPVAGSPFPMPSGWLGLFVDSIAVDPAGKFLYVPNAAADQVVGFTVDSTSGALGSIPGSPFATGASPQEVAIHPSGKFLYLSDGNDPQGGISAFTIDSSSGTLSSISGSPFPTTAGGGPDGLLIDPTGKFLYAALPFSNAVAAFTIDSGTGVLTQVSGSPFAPVLTGGTFPILYSIAIAPSGKYLYALGGGNAKIYGFSINPTTGALDSLASSPFNISVLTYMSNLVPDPSGKFLYIADETGTLFYMGIDDTTGDLTDIQSSQVPAYARSLAVAKAK
jgi:6-phosphogluconolactonase